MDDEQKILNEQLIMASDYGDVKRIKEFIDSGADVNARDKRGSTPLHYAVYYGNFEPTKYLIEHKADVNARDYEGTTVLSIACRNNNNTPIVEYLLEHGAATDIEIKNSEGRTPLDTAINYGSVNSVIALIEHGAKINKYINIKSEYSNIKSVDKLTYVYLTLDKLIPLRYLIPGKYGVDRYLKKGSEAKSIFSYFLDHKDSYASEDIKTFKKSFLNLHMSKQDAETLKPLIKFINP